MATSEPASSKSDPSAPNPKFEAWKRWNDELELSRKSKGYDQWQTRARKIIKRYRDERSDAATDTETVTGSRFNILWSNVQTLMPALFGKTPKPVVERRYLDKDDVGRTASVILERTLSYELDDGSYASALRKVVLDRLLPGRGVAWVRYEPRFTSMPGKTQEIPEAQASVPTEPGDGPDKPGAVDQEATSDAPEEQVASEATVVDYINWTDFMTSPARVWEEVWWIAKRVYMTREELVKRFPKVGRDIVLDWSPGAVSQTPTGAPSAGDNKNNRAKVWEIWDKQSRKVRWLAESYKEALLDEQDDPLHLESFWPVPKPLYATLTSDSLIPIPDYSEYQDQAIELDDLTTRISNLTKAIKVAGVYDASSPELKRMFEEGFENELVPCDNMAEFATKAGANGMGHVWLLPIRDMAQTLNDLYTAREAVKQSLYEITGISDIVRGQASTGAKTATEQRIKGQFASMRLNDMQQEVQRFARDLLRIMGEMIAEHFDPMTLYEISGFEQYAKEQWPPDPLDAAPQPPVAPMMGHNGGPPMAPAPVASGAEPMGENSAPAPAPGGLPPSVGEPGMGGAPVAPAGLPPAAGMLAPPSPPSPEQIAQTKAKDMFVRAVELLRNDKLRGFRIDIETDSLVEPDQAETQRARTELMGAISQFLPQAVEAGKASPELKPLLARLLMFFLRGFKASRDIEAAFEQFIDDMTKEASKPKGPPPPNPELIKVQTDAASAQAKAQLDGADLKIRAQFEAAKEQNRHAEVVLKAQGEQAGREAEMKKAWLSALSAIEVARIGASADADSMKVSSALEALLGFSQMTHDATQADLDRQHEAGMAASGQEHEADMQAAEPVEGDGAPAPAEAEPEPAPEAPEPPQPDPRIDEIMRVLSDLSAKVAENSKRSAGTKKIIHRDPDGLITHIETVG